MTAPPEVVPALPGATLRATRTSTVGAGAVCSDSTDADSRQWSAPRPSGAAVAGTA